MAKKKSVTKKIAANPVTLPAFKSDREILDAANELARKFYLGHGYQVPEGYRFDQAVHPQEKGMFNLAVMAYDHIDGTDVLEALANVEADEGGYHLEDER